MYYKSEARGFRETLPRFPGGVLIKKKNYKIQEKFYGPARETRRKLEIEGGRRSGGGILFVIT